MKLTNVLMVVAVLAVLVSGVNLVRNISLSQTGRASTTPGNVTLEIQQLIDINFTRNLINWSSGYVNTTTSCPTYPYAVLDTNNTANPIQCGIGWTPVNQGLIIQSDATLPIKINLTSDQNATTLFGAPATPSNFRWKVSEFSLAGPFEDTCDASLSPIVYTEIVRNGVVTICSNTQFALSQDELRIDFQVNLSKDAPPAVGYKTATITATAWL